MAADVAGTLKPARALPGPVRRLDRAVLVPPRLALRGEQHQRREQKPRPTGAAVADVAQERLC